MPSGQKLCRQSLTELLAAQTSIGDLLSHRCFAFHVKIHADHIAQSISVKASGTTSAYAHK